MRHAHSCETHPRPVQREHDVRVSQRVPRTHGDEASTERFGEGWSVDAGAVDVAGGDVGEDCARKDREPRQGTGRWKCKLWIWRMQGRMQVQRDRGVERGARC